MRWKTLLACTLTAAALGLAAGLPSPSSAAEKAGYRIGERLPQAPAAKGGTFKEISWDSLMPAKWNPMKGLEGINLASLNDGDPRAQKALEEMRKAWDEAPVEPSLNGISVRIAGFVVPLDGQRGQVSEFLLVPYFGACIHTPPPPANQVIHVLPAQPLKAEQTTDAVWVNGVLETVRAETGMGNAGYRMKAVSVTPYRRP